METAYREFRAQHPHAIPATVHYTPIGSKQEPLPPVMGKLPPLTLLPALNEVKPTQTTIILRRVNWRIQKHHMTAQELAAVPQHCQEVPLR